MHLQLGSTILKMQLGYAPFNYIQFKPINLFEKCKMVAPFAYFCFLSAGCCVKIDCVYCYMVLQKFTTYNNKNGST